MKLYMILKEAPLMSVKVGDRVEMKKPHPCGSKEFEVLRVGMDFKLRCLGCGREVMRPRTAVERAIKNITRTEEETR